MLQDQMNIVVRFKYFIKLKNIWMANLPQQVDLIMETEHRLYIILKHRFTNGLESKLTSLAHMCHLVDFGKVTFSYKIANLVL